MPALPERVPVWKKTVEEIVDIIEKCGKNTPERNKPKDGNRTGKKKKNKKKKRDGVDNIPFSLSQKKALDIIEKQKLEMKKEELRVKPNISKESILFAEKMLKDTMVIIDKMLCE